MAFHGSIVPVCHTPAKLIVYYHAQELAFSCLQQCTLTNWGMFFFISFQFLSAKCCCSVSIHTLIDVASFYRGVLFCLSLGYTQKVLCLQGSGLGETEQLVVVGLIVFFTYLFNWCRLFVQWHVSDIFRHIQSVSIFSTRKDSVKVSCWEKVSPEPFDHFVLSCCLPGFFVFVFVFVFLFFCGSLWCCKFHFQLAFISSYRRKGMVERVLCFIFFIVPLFLFSFPKVMVTVSHFSLWPSLLKKVSLLAMQAVQSLCVCLNHKMVIISITFGMWKKN